MCGIAGILTFDGAAGQPVFRTLKHGFAVLLREWPRALLRPLVEGALFSSPLHPEAVFGRQGLRRYWEDRSGRRDRKRRIWTRRYGGGGIATTDEEV